MAQLKFHSTGIYLLTCLVLALLSGCAHFGGDDDYIIPKAADPESLHQIGTLELEKAAEEESIQLEPEEPAPAELELTLAECRALVLENNLGLKVQLINPAIAAESVSQEEANFESTFSASTTYSMTNEPSTTTLNIEGTERDMLRSQLKVKIPLRTGGEINVNLTDTSTETNSEFQVQELNPYYTNNLSASIIQPLLKGAGRRANEYSIRVAELNRQVTDAETKLQVITYIADVDEAYWNLYAYRKVLEVQRQQYEYTNALCEEIEAYVKVGSKTRVDLIRARANVASTLKAIIVAENDVRNQERVLKQKLNKPGLGIETETILIPSTLPDPVRYDIQKDKMVADALENRMELLKEELNLLKYSENIDKMKNQRLPDVSLSYTYGINALGASRSDAYDFLMDNTFNDHSVGLNVSIPLGNADAESRLREAIYQRAQQLATRENRKQLITKEVLQQIDQVEAYWQGILVCREDTIGYDEQYRAEKRQFELGMVTATEVLEAQKNLAGAQKDEISAIVNYQISLTNLAEATGTLLGAAKVQWAPFVPGE